MHIDKLLFDFFVFIINCIWSKLTKYKLKISLICARGKKYLNIQKVLAYLFSIWYYLCIETTKQMHIYAYGGLTYE